ncbi:NAD(P)H:quinone oxidoreductase type IV [Longimycelium tulufanense]|uniref:NAD(P)H:quinone oxidoreductase type IV n=1 Tax=Longimycelium tulufanense TaxID=907463 RepID=A0A8J3FUE7_9PSEU|nr:NAD(P)H:quinone oxidoreductase [Longimycelium tulufanense]GGM42977.1 NAD(P)H:quinone oxidoreductase type IV [Longimycelium tulufanense]
MTEPVKVAVVYYSSTGNTHTLAEAVAEGAEKAGAEVRLRRVAELAPPEAIAGNPAWQAHHDASRDIAVASPADLVWADAVVLGTPTRFGNVASQLKQFLDTLGGQWSQGQLADKVYSGFVSTSTPHGGRESTLLALYNTVHHFGGILVTPGYTDPIQFATGTPYGPSHHDAQGQNPLTEETKESARYTGKRVTQVAAQLKTGRAVTHD